MMRALAVATLALAACHDPASLEVRAPIREPGVDAVTIHVARNKTILADCRLEAMGGVTGTCPFEDGRGKWNGVDELAFILYGNPGTELEVTITGEIAGDAITSTTARVTLPSRHGEDAERVLTLPARTEVARTCTFDLPRAGAENQTALGLADVDGDGRLEIVAHTALGLFTARYTRTEAGCALASASERRLTLCTPRPGVVLTGQLLPDQGPDALIECNVAAALSFVAVPLASPTAPLRRADTGRTSAGTSPAVLADLDGDGTLEAAWVSAEAGGGELALSVWRVATATSAQSLPMRNLRAPDQLSVPFAPLVVPSAPPRSDLIVVGYTGGSAYFEAARGLATFPAMSGISRFAPSITRNPASGRLAIAVVPNRSRIDFAELGVGRQSWFVRPPDLALPAATGVHVAIGDVSGDGKVVALAGEADRVHVFPVEHPDGARTSSAGLALPIPGAPAGPNAPVLLLANLDGRKGAEIVAYNPSASAIYAMRADGTALDGWPIVATNGSANQRAILADLDADGSAELIVLAGAQLRVFSLGKGSHDPAGWPWPMPSADTRGSAGSFEGGDLLRR